MSVPQVEIAVNTQSEQVPNWNTQTSPPTITINGNPVEGAENKPYTASGWQVVVLDQTQDLTKLSAVMSNQFISLQQDNGSWGYWEGMYAMMTTQLLTSGNVGTQIVIVASYAIDLNVPPTNDALEQLLTYGAGPELQAWLKTAVDAGSEGGDWTSQPANYILVGASALGYGNGTEQFNTSAGGGTLPASVTAMFANPAAGTPPTA